MRRDLIRAALLGWMTRCLAALSAAFISWGASASASALSPAAMAFWSRFTARLSSRFRSRLRLHRFSFCLRRFLADVVFGMADHLWK